MDKRSKRIETIISLLFSLFAAAGAGFILYAVFAGEDDILSRRETVLLCLSVIMIMITAFLMGRKLPVKIILLSFCCAFLVSLAVNFEYPELMKKSLQFPAENKITITECEEGASLVLDWAYWFRPDKEKEDVFLTQPDGDISFSQLQKTGSWEEVASGDALSLTSGEKNASVGITKKLRTHLAVLCFKAAGGMVQVSVSGQNGILTITPEMTSDQPFRIVLSNGLLNAAAGNILQIFLCGGFGWLFILCGITLCHAAKRFQGKNKKICICLCGFLIPCLILVMLCVFLKITPFGEKSFLINDMWSEYSEYMAYFRTVPKENNDLLYSFSKSLGDDLPSLLSFYVINPLNWLTVLFKPEEMPKAVTLLVILRFGISGFAAAVYFVNRRRCSYSVLLFSTCYALMTFNIVNAENTNLREGTLLLPIIIMGLEQLIEGKSPGTFIWPLASVIFLNYYTGYQICIFAGLYFIYYFFREERNISFLKSLLEFVKAVVLSVGISAFLLVPIVIQLQSGPKSVDLSKFGFVLNMPWSGLIGKLFASAYDVGQISDGYPSLYVGLGCLILLLLYFFNHGISGRKKTAAAGFLLASVLILQINPLNLALHGFAAPLWWPFRYSFIICFFMIITAQECFSNAGHWRKYELILSVILLMIIMGILAAEKYSWLTVDSLKMNGCLILSFFLVFLSVYKKQETGSSGMALLGVLTLFELFLNASHILSMNTAYERSVEAGDYAAYYYENEPVFDWLKKEDEKFYRVEKTYSKTPNEPLAFNYQGITHYSSTLNQNVMDFLQKTGFRVQPPYRINYWDGSDIAMDSFLGIKYLIGWNDLAKPYDPVFTSEPHTIYENPYALPVMFTASSDVFDADIDPGESGFGLQNHIFSALTGEDIRIYMPLSVKESKDDGLTGRYESGDICYSSANDGKVTLAWEFSVPSSDMLYAFFPAASLHHASLTLNNDPFGEYYDASSYHIQRIGAFQPDTAVNIEMTSFDDELCLNDAQFYQEDLTSLMKAVDILKQDQAELNKITSSRLEGTFTASSEKALFFTIPYDKGWTVRIDGQKVTAQKIFDTFMAVRAPEGTHRITLHFVPVGLISGTIVSAVSVIAAIYIAAAGRKKSTENQ